MLKETICFSKTYTESVVLHETLICWGGFGQPKCKYLKKCLKQFSSILNSRRLNNLLKKADKKYDRNR